MSHHSQSQGVRDSLNPNGALVESPGSRQRRSMAENNGIANIHHRNIAGQAVTSGDVGRNMHREPTGHDSGTANNMRSRSTSLSSTQSGNADNQSCESVDSTKDDGAVNKEHATKMERPECPVCLQSCTQPVKLPCSHVFCFLCLKGIALQNGRCALCRTGIPRDFLNNPDVLLLDEEASAKAAADEQAKPQQYQWFYEGTAGWWQYEERNAVELEEKYQSGVKLFEMVIVGLVFVVDLNHMVQYRRNDPNKRRRIKRDAAGVSKKGVAGIKVRRCVERSSGDGGESSTAAQPALPPPPPARSAPLLQPVSNTVIRGTVHRPSPALMTSSSSQQLQSTVGRRLRSLRRNGSDSDSASDDTDVQAPDGLARRVGQRPTPIGDEGSSSSSNPSSVRTLVGAPTMYVHSAATTCGDQRGDGSFGDNSLPALSHTSTAPPTSGSRAPLAVVPHDVRIVDGQDSPLYYSGMTTPSNTPRSVASGTGSPTERHVPTHSVHFEALIDGITGLVSGDGSSEDRLTPTSGAQ